MNTRIPINKYLRRLPSFAMTAALASVPLASGQNEKEEIFELSPFMVDGTDSIGYAAQSTLAGSKIKTPLKDLGQAISVITEEFISDTGGTNVQELLMLTTGTEVGGPGGNFSGSDIGGTTINGSLARRDPQSSARIRGVGRPNYTRGYFSSNIWIDTYNTSGITVSRGPNSIIFGLGNPAGVINNDVKFPIIGQNKSELQFRYGENGTTRATADITKTLVEGRLAMKASTLYSDTKYDQEPAFTRDKRAYLALNGVLANNDNVEWLGKTSVRASFEVGALKRTPPTSFAPSIAYSSFYREPIDFRPYTGTDYATTYDRLAANWSKWATLDTRARLVPDPNNPGQTIYENVYKEIETPIYSTPFLFGLAATVWQNGSEVSGVGLSDSSLQGMWGWGPTIDNAGNRDYAHIVTRDYSEDAQGVGFTIPTLANRNVFDYKKSLLTGGMEKITTDFDAETFTFEQALFNNKGGFEFTLDQQYYTTDFYQPMGTGGRGSTVYIDTTEFIPGGANADGSVFYEPNPNVGRALVMNYYNANQAHAETSKRENWRASAFYELDFKDVNEGLGKWLGNHRFTAVKQEEDLVTSNLRSETFWEGVGFDYAKEAVGWGNAVTWGTQTGQLIYLSGDLRGVEEGDVRLSQIPAGAEMVDGDTFKVNYRSTSLGGDMTTGTVRATRYDSGGGIGGNKVESEVFVWQPKFLNDHIVGLAGWRKDKVSTRFGVSENDVRNSGKYGGEGFYNANGEFQFERLELAGVDAFPWQDTFTYSIVGHLPQTWADNLPVSSASVFYNEAENFSAIAQRRDIFDDIINNPQGTTTEIGFRLGFADDKWQLKFNKFETSNKFESALGSETGDAFNFVKGFANAWHKGILQGQDFSQRGDAIDAGFTSFQQVVDALIGVAEKSAGIDVVYDTVTQEYQYEHGINGLSSTTDTVAEGYELELVGNPSKNWRSMFNLVQVETSKDNSGEQLQRYSDAVVADLKAANLWEIKERLDGIVPISVRWGSGVVNGLSAAQAKDGTNNQEERKYRANFVNTFSFHEGRFRGFSVGGALRYQSKVATGYQYMLNENGVPVPDVSKAFFGDSEFNGDLWFIYQKKLSNKIDWKIQLNLNNLIGSQDDILVKTNPNGDEAVFRIAPDKSWFVTNTFSF